MNPGRSCSNTDPIIRPPIELNLSVTIAWAINAATTPALLKTDCLLSASEKRRQSLRTVSLADSTGGIFDECRLSDSGDESEAIVVFAVDVSPEIRVVLASSIRRLVSSEIASIV
jgi:hypothetical protein